MYVMIVWLTVSNLYLPVASVAEKLIHASHINMEFLFFQVTSMLPVPEK